MGDFQFSMAGKEREASMDRYANRMAAPAEPSNPPPGVNTTTDYAPAAYASQTTAIYDKAKAEGVSITDINSVAREKSKVAEERFTSESTDWRKWYAESLVWGYFFNDSPFPGKEPSRVFPLRSSSDLVPIKVQKYAEDSGLKWFKTPFEGDGRIPKAPKAAPCGSLHAPMPEPGPIAAPRSYFGMESKMEAKARALGGLALRREFFKFLQKQRDLANAQHRDCQKEYRQWMADSLTWEHFFSREPFPGKEPVGKGVHSGQCIILGSDSWRPVSSTSAAHAISISDKRSSGVLGTSTGRSSNPQARTAYITNDQLVIQGPSSAYSKHTADDRETSQETLHLSCFVGGNRAELKFSRSFPKQVFEEMLGHLNYGAKPQQITDLRIIEEALRCAYMIIEVSPTTKRIALTTHPDLRDSRERACALENGFNFLLSWVDTVRANWKYSVKVKEPFFPLSIINHWKCYTNKKSTYSQHDTYHPRHEADYSLNDGSSLKAPVTVMATTKREEALQKTRAVANVYQNAERLVFHGGACKESFNCSDSSVKNIAYAILVDNQKGDLEETLKCRILVHERKRNDGCGLSIQVVPFENSPRGVLEKASRFITSWIRRGLEATPAKLSTYWQAWNRADPTSDHIPEPVIELGMVETGIQTEVQIPLGDPEYDWDKFAEAFGATEVDRVLMEEQVKVEGCLRMVLDHATEDIVSLAEFEERTKLRYRRQSALGKIPRGVEQAMAADGPKKRLADNVEGDEDKKRARLINCQYNVKYFAAE